MAKRFTDSEKWNDPWFCELNSNDKLFWIYIIDNCDHAGIWKVNWPLVKFHIKDFVFNKQVFNGRIKELSSDTWFISKFIDFQYGELNEINRAHLSVINILKKEGAYKGLIRGLQGRKDKDMDMDMDKDKDNTVAKEKFLEFVYLTRQEFDKLNNILGEPQVKEMIERLNNYIGSKGEKYKSHYHTILSWYKKDHPKESKSLTLRRPL